LESHRIDQREAQFEVEKFWMGALRNAAVDGDIKKGSLMAGQSVGLVGEIMPIKAIINEMNQDAEAELQRLHAIFKKEE
ncbi:MAG: 2-nitropropane dioxygenase, partial [Desulfobacterales bacterium]|nr:2-nitropropane dioxygenase [Desulfobacterales bacterium]